MVCFGTYRLSPQVAENMVEYAIRNGNIVNIDTAQLYKNQDQVLRKVRVDMGKLPDEVSITTKIQRKLIEQCELDNRGVVNSVHAIIDYSPNCILLHAPVENFHIAWKQLTSAFENRGIHLGVSNFDVKHLQFLESLHLPKPYINQIEISPFNQNRNVTSYCTVNNIKVESHSALTKGEKFNNDIIRQIAQKHNTTIAKVFVAYNLTLGYMPIFSTSKIDHFNEDYGGYPKLDEDDIHLLNSLECQYRTHPQYKYD
jgi:diketogulonate reductase-like aldo/keto reductase